MKTFVIVVTLIAGVGWPVYAQESARGDGAAGQAQAPEAGVSTRRDILEKRLRELVAQGKLTGKEARELLTLAFPDPGTESRLGMTKQQRRKKGANRRQLTVKDPDEFGKLQEKPIFSGPQVGERLPSFTATGINGEFAGKQFDPVVQANGKPQILIFQDESGVGLRGLLGFARTLPSIQTLANVELQMSVIFLGDDPVVLKERTRGIKRYVHGGLVMAISQDGRDGPGAYGLNRNVAVTILVAKDGIVQHNFAFPQPTLVPDPHLLGAVAELIDTDLKKFERWLNEQEGSQRMRAPTK